MKSKYDFFSQNSSFICNTMSYLYFSHNMLQKVETQLKSYLDIEIQAQILFSFQADSDLMYALQSSHYLCCVLDVLLIQKRNTYENQIYSFYLITILYSQLQPCNSDSLMFWVFFFFLFKVFPLSLYDFYAAFPIMG